MTDLIWKLIHHGDAVAREEARWQVKVRGMEIVPELNQAVEDELRVVRQFHIPSGPSVESITDYPNTDALEQLVQLLIRYEHPSSLRPLALVLAWRREYVFANAFDRLLTVLQTRASLEDIQALIETLAALRQERRVHTLLVRVATVILHLAERDPHPKFYPALPLIKPGVFVPWEFVNLYQRLRDVLKNASLPVAVVAPHTTDNLPLVDQVPPTEPSETLL
jgi:hypothetical protein